MSSGYVLDHRALVAGLGNAGSEHQRREISRLLHAAIEGGPTLAIPGLAVAAADAVRPGPHDGHALITAEPILAIDTAPYTGVPVDVPLL